MKLHIGLVLLLSLAPLPVRAQMFVLSTVSAHSQPSTAMNAKDVPRNSGLWGVEVAQLVPSASQEDAKESVVVVVKIAKHSPARHALSQGELIRWVGAGGSANGRVTNPAEFYMYASQCVRDCILQVSSGSGTTFIAGFRSVGKLGMNYLPEYDPKTKKMDGYLDTKTGRSYDTEAAARDYVKAPNTHVAEGSASPWQIAAEQPPSAGN